MEMATALDAVIGSGGCVCLHHVLVVNNLVPSLLWHWLVCPEPPPRLLDQIDGKNFYPFTCIRAILNTYDVFALLGWDLIVSTHRISITLWVA